MYSVWLWIWHSGYYSFSQVGICKCLILRKGENPSSQGWTYQRSQEDNHCSINQSNCDPGYETEQSVLFQQSCCSAQLSKFISPTTYFDLIAVCWCVVVRDLSISTDIYQLVTDLDVVKCNHRLHFFTPLSCFDHVNHWLKSQLVIFEWPFFIWFLSLA